MTLTLLTATNSFLSADFDRDLDIKSITYNDCKARLTAHRADVIWRAFDNAFDLNQELADFQYERRHRNYCNY
ncbi:MAG: hypothetical protein H0X41_11470 [Chitinophagaceae bacterium]|nr:hypothetical protein [Chitinophagaceae bacterium]